MKMLQKYHKINGNQETKELTSYHIIAGPNLFIEVEDLNERVLYDYDEIVRRQAEQNEKFSIDHLKLLPHYDTIRPQARLSLSELQEFLEKKRPIKNAKDEKSLKLYRQLEQYDAILNDIRHIHPQISFNDLTQGELMQRIGRIFTKKSDEEERYSRRPLFKYYQKRNMFMSTKANDIQIYEGIWYDLDNCYMVGSSQPMKLQQPRAHLIRRFDVYMGTAHFNIQPFLNATSAKFVRLNQFTVYPYAFHLIDLYVDNVLRFPLKNQATL